MSDDERRNVDRSELPLIWDGTTKYETKIESEGSLRRELADSARNYEWGKVLAILTEHPRLVNCARLEGQSLYTPLHQAAHAGADPEVVSELLRLGAWRTLRDRVGARAVDIAKFRSHSRIIPLLKPVCWRSVPSAALAGLQKQFHEVIRSRADALVREHDLRLPELEVLLECPPNPMWFAVPGMYGGFSYWLARDGRDPLLISESWCRVADGSGERHEITKSRWTLTDSGFV